ncbi:MAG: DUF2877 domain-containing protein [Erysipelotrichia bacterium]|nr:DUF2877 domain-containing protein [Erysipelotrichia bacterium]
MWGLMQNCSEKNIAMPFFSHREDWLLPSQLSGDARILHLYNSGFDAQFKDKLLFFAVNAEMLHPFAILVPLAMLDLVCENITLHFDATGIAFNDKNGTRLILQAAAPVKSSLRPSEINWSAIEENLQTLYGNLKLFGRSSIILDLLFGCADAKNSLLTSEMLILSPEPDLKKLLPFVGMGEGLTPSFDDFLSGMLFADRFLGINRIKIPKDFLCDIAGRTTIQAVQQLKFACLGLLSMRFESFLYNFASQKIKSSEVVKLLAHGHSSGTELLCGIWHYLAHIAPPGLLPAI